MIQIYLIQVTVCVSLFSLGSHTIGPTVLKFGMGDHIYPVEVIGLILFWCIRTWRSMQPKRGISMKISQNKN